MSALAHPAPRTSLNPVGIVIRYLLPNRGRRILFITSLYFRIASLEALKDEAIAKLNTLMQLSSHDSGMHLPALLHSFIWRKTPITDILKPEAIYQEVSNEEAMRISQRVVECAPRFVCYGSEQEMVDDVYKLITEGNRLVHAL